MSPGSGAPREVTIVGAGIVGISAAIHLQRDGCKVTVVDRLAPGEGTSLGNAGIFASCGFVPVATPGFALKAPGMLMDPMGPLSFRWSYMPRMIPWLYSFLRNSNPQAVERIADAMSALLGSSVEDHQALAAGTGAEEWVRPSPYLYVYPDEAAFQAEAYSWNLRRARGVKMDFLRGDAVREFEPALAPRYRFAAVLERHGYTPDPLQLVRALAAHFVRNGGTVMRREVRDIEMGADGPVRLLTDQGPVSVRRLVIAAGAWSGRLAARLGSPVPLESERGYHITLQEPGLMPRYPIMSTDGKFVATPMACGLRAAGMVEFGGLDAAPKPGMTQRLLKHVQRLFPGVSTDRYTEWMGHRPSLPDSLPVIGRSPHFESVFFAFGHQHVGITSGPKTGQLVADMVAGRVPAIDISPFRVERFQTARRPAADLVPA